MKGVGKLKFTQASVGAGYAYNWVPARGWLVNVMMMPMLQFYNRLSAYTYRIYDDDVDITDSMVIDIDGTGSETDDVADIDEENIEIREGDVIKTNNRFPYSNDKGHGHLSEWKAYATFGFRF